MSAGPRPAKPEVSAVEHCGRLLAAAFVFPHGSRRSRLLAGAIVVLGIAGLGAAMVAHANLDPDESQHLHAAWLIAQGRVPYADFWEHHMPSLAYALAPITRWFADQPRVYLAGRVVMAATAAATLGLVYVLGGRLGPGVGATAVALLGVQFRFLQHTVQVRPDGPALLTWLAAVLMLVRWRERGTAGWLWMAGLGLGLTATLTPKAAFLGLGAAAVVVLGSWHPSPRRRRLLGRIACLAAGSAVPLVALLACLAEAGGAGALRLFAKDVIVANLRFPDFIKQTGVGGEGIGFVTLGLAGIVMTLRQHGWRVLRHPVHGPLLVPSALLSGILLLPSTPAVYSYTWLPVIASGSFYAAQAVLAVARRVRAGAEAGSTALLALVAGGAFVVPVIVVGVLAFPSNRGNQTELGLMRLELAYACAGEAVLDGGPLAVFRPTALRYPSLVRGLRNWIERGVIPADVLLGDLWRARAPVGVLDSRLRLGGPISAFIARYYVEEPGGLLVAGTRTTFPAGAGETDIDLLIAGHYEIAVTPGIRVMIDGALPTPVTWLGAGHHRVAWSGRAGTLRVAVVPCAQRAVRAPRGPAPGLRPSDPSGRSQGRGGYIQTSRQANLDIESIEVGG